MKFAMTSLLTALSAAAFAATFSGWTGEGNPDLADPAIYGLEEIPATYETNFVTKGGYVFTASQDCTFGALVMKGAGITNIFRIPEGRTITLTKAVGLRGGGESGNYKRNTTILDGGTWDLSNVGQFSPNWHYSYGTQYNTLLLTNGVRVVNVKYLQNHYCSICCSILVRQGSYIQTSPAGVFRDVTSSRGAGSVFEVSGGSTVCVTNTGKTWYLDKGSRYSTNLVVGAGSMVTNQNNAAESWASSFSYTLIDDGGAMVLSGPYLFTSESSNNLMEVTHGGRYHSRSATYLPLNGVSRNNTLRIADGGVFKVGHVFYLRGDNNTIIVSNATFAVSSLFDMNSNAKGCEFRIQGDDNTLSRGESGFFGSANGCRLVFDDATARFSKTFYFSNSGATSNTVMVVNGSDVTYTGAFYMSNYASGTSPDGNKLFVGSGSSLSANWFNVSGVGCSVVVSNGTLDVCSSNSGMMLGSSNASFSTYSNATLIVEGYAPKASVTNVISFSNNSRLVLNVPENGFTTERPLVQSAGFMRGDSTGVTLEINGAGAAQKVLKSTMVATLWSSKGSLGFTDDEIAAAQATLPDKCTVYLSSDRKKLMLRISPDIGTMVIIR